MISSVGKDKIFSLKFSYFARKMIESKLFCALAVEWKSLQSTWSILCSLFMKYNLGSKSFNWHLHKFKARYLFPCLPSTWLTNHSSDWMGLFPLIGWDISQSLDIFDYQRRRHFRICCDKSENSSELLSNQSCLWYMWNSKSGDVFSISGVSSHYQIRADRHVRF